MKPFGKSKKHLLALQLPALEQPVLPEAPPGRIMKIAGMRSWVYGLMIATGISIVSAAGFYALLLSRIEEIPYIADGSFYGCSPAPGVVDVRPADEAPAAPTEPVLEPLAPISSEG